jgi:hypothetical protein
LNGPGADRLIAKLVKLRDHVGSVMDDRVVQQICHEIETIERLSARLEVGDRPGTLEADQALERGFGRLMSLKAHLRELGGQEGVREHRADPAIAELDRWVARLTDVLTDLRLHLNPGGASRIGYGFVLPGQRRQPHTRPH